MVSLSDPFSAVFSSSAFCLDASGWPMVLTVKGDSSYSSSSSSSSDVGAAGSGTEGWRVKRFLMSGASVA